MKRLFFGLILILGIAAPAFSAIPSAHASTPGFAFCDNATAATTNACKDVKAQESAKTNPVISTLKIALNLLAFIAGAAAVILLIVNGLRLVLSNGDASGVSSARSGLLYIVVGLVIVILARSIVVFLLDKI